MPATRPEVVPDLGDVAEQLVAQARADGVNLTGPGGVLTGLVRRVLETGLEAELSDHLGHERRGRSETGNHRNGTSSKTVTTELGEIDIAVPRDRDGSFDPVTVPKHKRRLDGFNASVISLFARGMTTGEIAGHLADIYDTTISRETISKITDAVVDDLNDWAARPLDPIYPVENFYLTDASGFIEQGDLQSTPSTGWDESIPYAGRNSSADSLTKEEVTETVAKDTANATWLPGINRNRAVVWRSSRMGSTRQLSGRPELTITVEPRESDFTVFAYLYEEYGRAGYGKLISHEPYTVRGGASGRDVTINLEMEPIVWEVNEGNRLVLVIDTVDANYVSETDKKMYLESNSGNPAVLKIPWR